MKTILFVCEHGSAKSVVAAAHFNKIAEARRVDVRAISRAIIPDAELHPAAVRGLEQDHLTLPEVAPRSLSQPDLDTAARVIAFCELPRGLSVNSAVERWTVPPITVDYQASRNAIIGHLERLLADSSL